jgi:ketosteroid isomerase-like protein
MPSWTRPVERQILGGAMSEVNVEIVRRCHELWARRDFPSLLALIDDDTVLDLSRNVFNPGVYRGREGFRRWVEAVDEVWDGLEPRLIEIVGDPGDHVVTAIRLSGRGRGSGVEAEMEGFQVWTLRDGRIVRVTGGYRDRAEALEAVGPRE